MGTLLGPRMTDQFGKLKSLARVRKGLAEPGARLRPRVALQPRHPRRGRRGVRVLAGGAALFAVAAAFAGGGAFAGGVFVEQVIRPTGLIDPVCIVRPVENQVDDLLNECHQCALNNQRTLVTTLTKRMAEDLTEYMQEAGIRVRYLHSDIDPLERSEIIRDLRLGAFDVLVGINLLREGLDIPECALVAILDADKEGFLRSRTSLVQTIGRAARNVEGRVILYADKITSCLLYTSPSPRAGLLARMPSSA